MSDAEKLEPGWYWVRVYSGGDWVPAHWLETRYGCWHVSGYPLSLPAIIGPRLTPPEHS